MYEGLVNWKYISPNSVATNGICTEKDINDLRDMFPVVRTAILNDMAREMNGQPIADHDESILKLFNDNAMMKIAASAWTRI